MAAIHEKLASALGWDNVFVDVDDIPLGTDFREHIAEVLERADICLVVIGEAWLGQHSKRLLDPGDFVRLELEHALRSGMTVIPCLIGNAELPPQDLLPDSLKDLVYRQAMRIRAGRDFRHDIDRLIHEVIRRRKLKQSATQVPVAPITKRPGLSDRELHSSRDNSNRPNQAASSSNVIRPQPSAVETPHDRTPQIRLPESSLASSEGPDIFRSSSFAIARNAPKSVAALVVGVLGLSCLAAQIANAVIRLNYTSSDFSMGFCAFFLGIPYWSITAVVAFSSFIPIRSDSRDLHQLLPVSQAWRSVLSAIPVWPAWWYFMPESPQFSILVIQGMLVSVSLWLLNAYTPLLVDESISFGACKRAAANYGALLAFAAVNAIIARNGLDQEQAGSLLMWILQNLEEYHLSGSAIVGAFVARSAWILRQENLKERKH